MWRKEIKCREEILKYYFNFSLALGGDKYDREMQIAKEKTEAEAIDWWADADREEGE